MSLAASLVALLDETVKVSASADRADLLPRLKAARERVLDPRRRIIVVGQLKQGKSQFVNALTGFDVCSVGDDETTAVPTHVYAAAQPKAQLIVAEANGAQSAIDIGIDQVIGITPEHPAGRGKPILRLEVGVPSKLLGAGIVAIDTPGVGGHASPHSSSVLGLIPAADAVLVLSDASTELTDPEVTFLRQVAGLCQSIALVQSKTDVYPHWREIVAANERHLAKAEIEVPLIPLSSVLRQHAVRLQDQSLAVESGFGPLLEFIRDNVIKPADQHTIRGVGLDVRATAEHLAVTLTAELAALRDPNSAQSALTDLRQARERAEDLVKKTSRWQTTLSDGVADLAADIDHDLRDRLRKVTREAEVWIDENDPAENWQRLADWMVERVGEVVGDNFVWAHERAVWLAKQVATHFGEAGAVAMPKLNVADIDGILEPVQAIGEIDDRQINLTQKVLVGMRGSYGGVLMFGLVTTFAGLALINPISIGAGVLLGTKAYREDRENRLLARRQEAKAVMRRFTEDVSFQVSKESKDRLRNVQRVLRDHFSELADQALRSLNDSLRLAQDAAATASTSRTARIADAEHKLKVVRDLQARADRLIAKPVTA